MQTQPSVDQLATNAKDPRLPTRALVQVLGNLDVLEYRLLRKMPIHVRQSPQGSTPHDTAVTFRATAGIAGEAIRLPMDLGQLCAQLRIRLDYYYPRD